MKVLSETYVDQFGKPIEEGAMKVPDTDQKVMKLYDLLIKLDKLQSDLGEIYDDDDLHDHLSGARGIIRKAYDQYKNKT